MLHTICFKKFFPWKWTFNWCNVLSRYNMYKRQSDLKFDPICRSCHTSDSHDMSLWHKWYGVYRIWYEKKNCGLSVIQYFCKLKQHSLEVECRNKIPQIVWDEKNNSLLSLEKPSIQSFPFWSKRSKKIRKFSNSQKCKKIFFFHVRLFVDFHFYIPALGSAASICKNTG